MPNMDNYGLTATRIGLHTTKRDGELHSAAHRFVLEPDYRPPL